MAKHTVSKRYLILIIIMITWAVVYYIGHSAYMSEYLKRIILDKAHSITDQRLSIQKVYVSAIPLSLEFKGVVVEHSEGLPWFEADKVKIYVDFVELFRKRLDIRRVLVTGADMTLNRDNVTMLSAMAQKDSGGEGLKIRMMDIRESNISYADSDRRVRGEGVNLSAMLKTVPEVSLNVKRIDYTSDTFSVSGVGAKGRIQFDGDIITLQTVSLTRGKSSLKGKGVLYSKARDFISEFRGDMNVLDLSKTLNLGLIKDGKLSSSGRVEYLGGELFMETKLSGEFYIESLMNVLKLNEPIRGLTEFSGELRYQSDALYGAAKAKMVKGHLYGVDIDRLLCDVSYDHKDGKLSFKNGVVNLYDGTARAEVYITLPHVDRFMIDVKADNVNAADVLKLINIDIDVSKGKISGALSSEGREFQPRGWFDSNFKTSEENILKRIKKAKGTFDSAGSIVQLENLYLETAESNMTINGSVHLEEKKLRLNGNSYTKNLLDFTSPYYNDVHGEGYVLFTVDGPFESPMIRGKIRTSGVSYSSFYYDTADMSFSYAKELLSIEDLIIVKGNEHHKLNGSILFKNVENLFQFTEPEFDLIANIRNLSAEQIVEEFKYPIKIDGVISANISLRGSLSDIKAQADILVSPLSLYGVPLDYLSTDVSITGDTFRFEKLTIAQRDSIISGDLIIDLKGNYRFNTNKVLIQLEHLPFNLNLDKGVIDIDVSGTGSLKDPFIKTTLNLSNIITEGIPVGDGEIEVVLKDRSITVRGMLFDGKTSIRAKIKLYDNYDWAMEAEFGSGIYDFIPAYLLKEIPEDLMLSLKGSMKLHGNKNDNTGFIRMESFNMSMYGMTISNSSEIIIRVERNKVYMDQVRLTSGNAAFVIEGSLIPDGELDLTIYGNSSLGIFKNLIEPVSSLKGLSTFVFAISGHWDKPILNGGISIEKSSVGIAEFPYKIVDLNSYIYIDNNKIVIEELSGFIGGGAIDIKGYALFELLKIQMFYIDASLKDATFRISRGIIINCDGQLVVRGESGKSTVVGQVMLNKARYTRRLDWKSELMAAKAIEKPRGTITLFEETELNIRIDGDKDIIINNNIASTQIKVELLLRGTVANPTLFGRIETDKGTVYFRNNDFEIIHASADFIDPDKINPYLDITAKTSVKGYNIRVAIEGQMPNLGLSLVSDPPLDETDILGLLTVGEVGSKLGGLEAGIGTAEATSLLTGKYQDVIEERLTLMTGLDRIQVEPYVSEKTGGIGPRITVSKKLIEDKLFVTYSSSVGASEGDVIKLEYQLNKNVSLIGVEDELGSLGGDIIFRFEFK